MFNAEEVEKELSKFGKYIVKQSKTKLTKSKGNATGNLYNSIGFGLKVMKNSFSMSFFMADYGAFVDEGVRGAKVVVKEIGRISRLLSLGLIVV